MGAEFQAVNIKAPQGDGVTPTNVRRFTVTAGSLVNALPDDWAGKYIYLYNEDAAEIDFYFTKNSAAVIAVTAASAAGAGAATQGGRLRASAERHVRVPSKAPEETLYFARIGTGAATVRLELASD